MKICIIGAGAIGGMLAARLVQAGESVTIVDRGTHLAAIRSHGLRLVAEDGTMAVAELPSIERISDLEPHDLYILAVKAPQLSEVAPQLRRLIQPHSMVMTSQNGIPWWYFTKHGGPFDGRPLDSTDPGSIIATNIPAETLLASVVYPAAALLEPGVIKHVEGSRIAVAEIDNSKTDRIRCVSDMLRRAGFRAPVVSDIRTEIWTKLWGNMSFNPVSALTHATMGEIATYQPTRELVAGMMAEAQPVAEGLGVKLPIPLEKRLAGAQSVGAHKTSMLQDVEEGRPLETDALVGSVIEIGHMVGVATPRTEAVYALVKLLSQSLQRNGAGLKVGAKELPPRSEPLRAN